VYVAASVFLSYASDDRQAARSIAKNRANECASGPRCSAGRFTRRGCTSSGEFADDPSGRPAHNPILAIPFAAPAGDSAAAKLADTAFAQTYGRLAMSRHGGVGLNKDSGASSDTKAAVERARAAHASYVVYGAVATQSSGQVLTVTVADAEDGAVVWTESYPSATADPSKIAAEVDSKVPLPDSD
jgi:TolB-like protein